MKSTSRPAVEYYFEQLQHAKERGILWNFTLESWMAWWGDDYEMRGRGKGKLQMCRKGDTGPYSPENTIKLTHERNSSDKRVNGTAGKRPPNLNGWQVSSIRQFLKLGVPQRKIAKMHGTSQRTVLRIKQDKYRKG